VSLPPYPFQRKRHWLDLPHDQSLVEASARSVAPASLSRQTETLETNESASTISGSIDRKNELEAALRALFGSLLHSDASRVDPQAPLLELGADSAVLVQAIRSIERSYGITLTVRHLFEELTTISAIAVYLDRQLPVPTVEQSNAYSEWVNTPQASADMQAVGPDIFPYAADEHHLELSESPTLVAEASASALERLISQQFEVFSRLTEQQLAAL
jgi:acyl carrier protein